MTARKPFRTLLLIFDLEFLCKMRPSMGLDRRYLKDSYYPLGLWIKTIAIVFGRDGDGRLSRNGRCGAARPRFSYVALAVVGRGGGGEGNGVGELVGLEGA